jgi:siroheme decarboxylase
MSDAIELDAIDRSLINVLQGGFPLVDRPFAEVAALVGIDETDVIARVNSLRERGVLTRFGPMFQVERMGGAFVLAALAVPEDRYDEVAQAVNSLPAIAHNYRREHALNMWFVLATEAPEGIPAAIETIEAMTGLPVYAFPKEREYFVELKLVA